MSWRIPVSLRVVVPLALLGFAATLSAVNLMYHVPKAERAAEEDGRKRLAQEMSRLQSTLEYLLLKGDAEAAQHEIEVLAHNHDVTFAALTDETGKVMTATRRTWLARPAAEALPQFDLTRIVDAARQREGMAIDSDGAELLGSARIMLGRASDELRPSRIGNVFLVYDLRRYKAEARAQVVEQSLYWAGWVTALALAMWLVFHFLLTRRTAFLVHAAEDFASGNLTARTGFKGGDELGRLSRAFDAMAVQIAETQSRLRRDIAARIGAETALRASEEQYRAMFNGSIDGLALWNAAGEIVDANPALWRMYGYGEVEASALRPARELGPCYHAEFLQAVLGGLPLHTEVTDTRKDGSMLQVELHGVPVQYQGKPHVLTIARDVTEKRRSAEELSRQRETLHQQEKLAALGSLLAGVAHELNNPLSVVVARAVLLEERGDPRTRAAAVKIRSAAERCARIVRTFLAMARQQKPQRGPVAINTVVTDALDIAGYAIRTSSIAVDLDLAQDLPPILADADQVHQVLLNLIINAQQALQDHPGPRRIAVRTGFDTGAQMVRVSVSDSGPGIAPQLRARIFEPYFTTKPTGVGLGVGLAVSLGIVEAHGGTLSVASPESGGARFDVALPIGEFEMGAVTPRRRASDMTVPREILVVDDEPEIRDTLRDILEEGRHHVVCASSGREALDLIASQPYDVILTDIRMADVDGRALFEQIRRRWPGKANSVIFVTGDTLASDLRDFVRHSGRPVIEKPFLPDDVRKVIAQTASAAMR